MSAGIASLEYLLACMAFRWQNKVKWKCFCKDEYLRRKQTMLPWCLLETISFYLDLNSRDFEIRGGERKKKGRRFRRLRVSRISWPCYCLFLSPFFVGNKHISKDELRPSLREKNVLHILEDRTAARVHVV